MNDHAAAAARKIAERIASSSSMQSLVMDHANLAGYLSGLLDAEAIDYLAASNLRECLTQTANQRLRALLNAPAGSPPSQRSPAAAEPAGAPLHGGA